MHCPLSKASLSSPASRAISAGAPLAALQVGLLAIKFWTVKAKLAAFQATSASRPRKIHFNDDITKAQQATQREDHPERRQHQDAGRQTWLRVDRLRHSDESQLQQRRPDTPDMQCECARQLAGTWLWRSLKPHRPQAAWLAGAKESAMPMATWVIHAGSCF